MDEQEIRTLIERWADAVHTGNLAGVLADHSADVLMFDVPPPYEGLRGLAAYERTWPGFFEWQAQGATFEIVSLDVTAGADVAFAVALLKCGMPDETAERRLRLTIGLRKLDGRWTITHEHHSFPLEEIPAPVGESAVRELLDDWSVQTAGKDLDAMMAGIAPDIVSYEHAGPLQYVGRSAVREVCQAGLDTSGSIELTQSDLTVLARNDLAVAWGIDHVTVESPDGPTESRSRATRIFRHGPNGWQLVHQHLSFPR
ncbi:Ketosteroid isomerase-like protein [Kribbella flavida DSM 17836]|uniref:Ketosteroid isomerase-like protein n=1 Tax=Kribbella flavida (strain DSM 17836 / JCM 10339 / NBRC 14399) TaxID=479435 RepID=D2PT47_KRIFD|nr:nuclear transport factor 2 family protein [Kribbella flavida]ADB29363.1 Ketosteroid isomerase-like protein [Kribbella flavida DSM 17836]